jgi:hypothetical protein
MAMLAGYVVIGSSRDGRDFWFGSIAASLTSIGMILSWMFI